MINNLQSILTQDNRMTSDPIFLVQGWERIFVEDGEFVTYVENETGDYCEMSQEDFSHLEDLYLEAKCPYKKVSVECPEDPVLGGDFDPDNWERREYILRPVFMTACFTEKAAQDYIDCNGHNAPCREFKAPRIYVESGWRNKEWQQIRELLIAAAKKNENSFGELKFGLKYEDIVDGMFVVYSELPISNYANSLKRIWKTKNGWREHTLAVSWENEYQDENRWWDCEFVHIWEATHYAPVNYNSKIHPIAFMNKVLPLTIKGEQDV